MESIETAKPLTLAQIKLRKRRSSMHYRYLEHRNHARARGIAFLISEADWIAWWRTDDRWARRTRRSDGIVMSRPGDLGPYHVDNIRPLTRRENTQEAMKGKPRPVIYVQRSVATRLARGSYCDPARRATCSLNRPIETPDGRFASATFASERYGISKATASRRAREGLFGWRYTDEAARLPPITDLFDPRLRIAA